MSTTTTTIARTSEWLQPHRSLVQSLGSTMQLLCPLIMLSSIQPCS